MIRCLLPLPHRQSRRIALQTASAKQSETLAVPSLVSRVPPGRARRLKAYEIFVVVMLLFEIKITIVIIIVIITIIMIIKSGLAQRFESQGVTLGKSGSDFGKVGV